MTVANVSANKISTIPRQCHPAAITKMVMVGLHCPLGDATRSECSRKPRLLVIYKYTVNIGMNPYRTVQVILDSGSGAIMDRRLHFCLCMTLLCYLCVSPHPPH